MSLTTEDYIARMMHATKGTGTAAGVMMLDLLNESLRDLFNFHDWTWRKRPPILLDLVEGQSYVALPTDFGYGELLTVHSITSPILSIRKVGLDDIATLRGSICQDSISFFVALSWPSQASQAVGPAQAQLEIFPTPTSSVSGAFRCVYKAGPIDLAKNTDVPNIPRAYEAALSHLARGKAKFYEFGDMMEIQMGQALLAELKEADGMQEADAGYITGGAVHTGFGNSVQYRPFTNASIPDH